MVMQLWTNLYTLVLYVAAIPLDLVPGLGHLSGEVRSPLPPRRRPPLTAAPQASSGSELLENQRNAFECFAGVRNATGGLPPGCEAGAGLQVMLFSAGYAGCGGGRARGAVAAEC